MKTRFAALVALTVVVFCASPVFCASSAQAGDGWSLSKLNPFKRKPTATERARDRFAEQISGKSRFSRGNLPGWGSRSRIPAKKPSTLTKLNRGAKDFFGKTKDTLMPWSKDTKKKRSYSRTRTKAGSPFSLTSWLPEKKAEPQRSRTLPDFIGAEKPSW